MVILYPTETVYGLGVNAFDKAELDSLYALKGRDAEKAVSWLVRDMNDVSRYAAVSDKAAKIAERFLPGPLTLLLPPKKDALPAHLHYLEYVSFRISSDRAAQKLTAQFMEENDSPLTCTSANLSGMPTLSTVDEILAQFGDKKDMIDTIIDGGVRVGVPSTIIKVTGEKVECVREGSIPMVTILSI